MKKRFIAPALRVEATLARLTLEPCTSCAILDGDVTVD
jgi:hypothetical protein